MSSLRGPVLCPAFRGKQAGLYPSTLAGQSTKPTMPQSDFWGFRRATKTKARIALVSRQSAPRKSRTTQRSFSSSADVNGSMAENFNENDEDYVNSSVVEAVEVKSGADGFMIKMRDGRHLRCVHNNPQGGHLPDYAPHSAIVLKMEDGTVEMPSVLLMAAVRHVQMARPTLYQVVSEMIDKMGYEAILLRLSMFD